MNLNATLFAQFIVFFILAWFTMKFVWPPLVKAMDERAKKIADGLAAAEEGNRSLQDAEKRIAEIEAEARANAQQILAETERRAGKYLEEQRSAAQAEGERMLTQARAEIEQEVVRARQALREQVAALAVQGAERILQREVDAKAHADLLSQLQTRL